MRRCIVKRMQLRLIVRIHVHALLLAKDLAKVVSKFIALGLRTWAFRA